MRGTDILKMFGQSAASAGNLMFVNSSVSGDSLASWIVGSDGFIYTQEGPGTSEKGAAWINPQSGMNLYEIEAHVESGTAPSGSALDSWLNCTSGVFWSLSNSGFTTKKCTLTISVRRASDGSVLETFSVSLFASGQV